MYFRIAVQTFALPALRWQSDTLCSLPSVVEWLRYFRVFPPERLRVFSSPERELLDEQLRRAHEGFESASVPATRFMPARASAPSSGVPASVAARPPSAEAGRTASAQPPSYRQPLMATPLDLRRDALERGPGGDADCSYRFRLPISTPELLTWVALLARVRYGDLRADVVSDAGTDGAAVDVLAAHARTPTTHTR
jgi:hypothetical protein